MTADHKKYRKPQQGWIKTFIAELVKKDQIYKMAPPDFHMVNGEFFVTEKVRQSFEENGFILVRGLFDSEEVDKLRKCMNKL